MCEYYYDVVMRIEGQEKCDICYGLECCLSLGGGVFEPWLLEVVLHNGGFGVFLLLICGYWLLGVG